MGAQEVEVFLEHFGVLGMHWGIRNDKEKQASRELKAKKFDVEAQQLKTLYNNLSDKQPHGSFERNRLDKKKAKVFSEYNRAVSDAKAKRQGKLSSKQRRVLIGTSAAAAILTAYGTYSVIQSGEAHSLAIRGKGLITGSSHSWNKNSTLSTSDMTPDALMTSVVSKINPDYGKFGTKQNCRRATFAYEMRRRGFDVAATRTTNARGQDASGVYNVLTPGKSFVNPGRGGIAARMAKEFISKKLGRSTESPFTKSATEYGFLGKNKIGKPGASPSMSSIFEHLSKYPNGARGELAMKLGISSGHSMAWEITHGKPVIFDAQSNKMFKSVSDLTKFNDTFNISEASTTRLDNIPLNTTFLTRWLKNA